MIKKAFNCVAEASLAFYASQYVGEMLMSRAGDYVPQVLGEFAPAALGGSAILGATALVAGGWAALKSGRGDSQINQQSHVPANIKDNYNAHYIRDEIMPLRLFMGLQAVAITASLMQPETAIYAVEPTVYGAVDRFCAVIGPMTALANVADIGRNQWHKRRQTPAVPPSSSGP